MLTKYIVAKVNGNDATNCIQRHLNFDHGFINVSCGIMKCSIHVMRLSVVCPTIPPGVVSWEGLGD